MVTMETMTVRKISTSISLLQFWLCISKFCNCRKFQYHQKAGQKVINYQNFQFFASDHLNNFISNYFEQLRNSWDDLPEASIEIGNL